MPLSRAELPSENLFDIYMQQVKQIPILTAEEETALAYLATDGEVDAQRQLIEANLRLVVLIVNRYYQKQAKLDKLDLIQAGNIGLMESVTKFRPEMGYRFSTYATVYIRSHISREIRKQGQTIRLPDYVYDQVGELVRVQERLTQQFKRLPTVAELATALQINESRCAILLRAYQTVGSATDLSQLTSVNLPAVTETDSDTLQNVHAEQIRSLLSELPAEQQAIIKLRFGIEADDCCSYAEISRQLSLPYERVRLTCIRLLERCRQPDKWQACHQMDVSQ